MQIARLHFGLISAGINFSKLIPPSPFFIEGYNEIFIE